MKQNAKVIFTLSAALAACGVSNAALVSQLGILDLAANGGINPNTGVAWAAGDQYRLAFHTADGIAGTFNDPAVYDTFATAQANLSTLGNGAITTSVGWTALVWVNTDPNLPQGDSLSSPSVRAGITDFSAGAGVPVFTMNGMTSIAANNADIADGWSNPFGTGSGTGSVNIRLAAGSTNNNSDGNPIVAAQNVFYSPFLDQFGLGDSATIHGRDVATGGTFTSHVNALGTIIPGSPPATGADPRTTHGRGNSNPNNGGAGGRAWNRFTDADTAVSSVYALSPLLTVTDDAVPEPTTGLLGLLGGLMLLRRRRN